jgi:hypothetical protein
MKTLALMTTKQLNSLLATFPASAKITRTNTTVRVNAPDGKKVLSAVSPRPGKLNVQAKQGMVEQSK